LLKVTLMRYKKTKTVCYLCGKKSIGVPKRILSRLGWVPISRFFCEMGSRCPIPFVLIVCLLVGVVGCDGGDNEILWEQNRKLRQDNAGLSLEITQLQAEKKELETRILKVLPGLDTETRLANLVTVKKIEIAKRTGFYDKDNDGTKEKLIVYVRPIDEMGDCVKAAGEIEVQLWDLNRPAEKALLGQWQKGPGQLKKLWADTFMSSSYRLTFPVPDKITGREGALTLKVSFIEYLTGATVKAQRVIDY